MVNRCERNADAARRGNLSQAVKRTKDDSVVLRPNASSDKPRVKVAHGHGRTARNVNLLELALMQVRKHEKPAVRRPDEGTGNGAAKSNIERPRRLRVEEADPKAVLGRGSAVREESQFAAI